MQSLKQVFTRETDSLGEQFKSDWLRVELSEARRRAQRCDLAGTAAEAFVFDRMTAVGYRLNLVRSEYYIP